MRLLIETTNKAGHKVFKKVDRVEKIVIFDEVKAVLQINKDLSQCNPERGQKGDDTI